MTKASFVLFQSEVGLCRTIAVPQAVEAAIRTVPRRAVGLNLIARPAAYTVVLALFTKLAHAPSCAMIKLQNPPLSAYLSIVPPCDVIERPSDAELDLGGWDLRKALGLMVRFNAVVLEWLASAVVSKSACGHDGAQRSRSPRSAGRAARPRFQPPA